MSKTKANGRTGDLKNRLGSILTEAQAANERLDLARVGALLRAGLHAINATSARAVHTSTADMAEDPDTKFSRSVQAAFAILAIFDQAPDDLIGVAEVARETGGQRSTVHRYLQTLVLTGQLEQPVGTRKYRRVVGEG